MTHPGFELERVVVRRPRTDELSASDLAAIRTLMYVAFASEDEEERFADSDWEHALGGVHVLAELNRAIVGHASVVERVLEVDGRPVRTGYVEAVATAPALQGHGIGTRVMRAANELIRETCELGALGTGEHGFYERLGWQVWQGPLFVRTPVGEERTPEEEGGILVLTTPSTGPLDLGARLSCDWREGDVW